MKSECDFFNAGRGKFYRKDGVLELPVYLDAGVRDYLTARQSQGRRGQRTRQ